MQETGAQVNVARGRQIPGGLGIRIVRAGVL
jgi:hypothetical protein